MQISFILKNKKELWNVEIITELHFNSNNFNNLEIF